MEFDELFEPLSDLLEFEFDELLELEFDELLELEFEELLELEFEELLELEFEELLPANFSNLSSEFVPIQGNSCVAVIGVRMMLLMPPVSTAACEAPVAPVIAANANASREPVLGKFFMGFLRSIHGRKDAAQT